MPIDVQPDEFKGNVVIYFDQNVKMFRVIYAYALDWMRRNFPNELYRSHFDTCSHSKKYRK